MEDQNSSWAAAVLSGYRTAPNVQENPIEGIPMKQMIWSRLEKSKHNETFKKCH